MRVDGVEKSEQLRYKLNAPLLVKVTSKASHQADDLGDLGAGVRDQTNG